MGLRSTAHGSCGVEQASLRGWELGNGWDPLPGKSEVLGHWRLWFLTPGCPQCPLREDLSETLCQARLFCPSSGGRKMPRPLGGISQDRSLDGVGSGRG